MSGVGRDYKVPIPDTLDNNVPLVPSRGQEVPRTTQVLHVEVQSIFTEWNIERIGKWKSNGGKLVPKLETLDN